LLGACIGLDLDNQIRLAFLVLQPLYFS
jgi:hypothetical protein